MKAKKLLWMAIALMVLAGVAAIQKWNEEKEFRAQKKHDVTLFQGVDLNLIDGLAIVEGSNSVNLAKEGGVWVVGSLYNYPADFGKLAAALQAAASKISRPVRASNVNASEYGFGTEKSIVLKSGGQEAVRLEIGARRAASSSAGWADQRFIRRGSTGAIHLADHDFRPFSEKPADWINTELLNISSSDIVSVRAGAAMLKVDGTVWALTDLDDEQEELQSSEANKLRMALQHLNCITVANPAKSDADLGFTNAAVYTAQTTNQIYTVTVGGETSGGRYIRLGGDAPERLKEWTYVISTYDAYDFLIGRDKLVKKREAPEDPPEE